MQSRAILLLGSQGAGKGTVGAFLAEELNGIHLSAGDLLRARAAIGGHVAQEIHAQIDQGLPVPAETSYGLLKECLQESSEKQLLILDGFPRDAAELPLLNEIIGGEARLALLLNVPTPIAVARLLARESCGDCGASYGPGVPPSARGVCDCCGGPLSHRADDSPQGIGRRMEGWAGRSPEILAHFRHVGTLVEIDAAGPSTQVSRSALEVVRDRVISGL
jgi:adenylate kinase